MTSSYWKSVLPYLSTDVVAQYLEHHTSCEWWHNSNTRIPIRFKNIPPIMYEYLCVHYDDLIQYCIQNKYVQALNVLYHSHMIVRCH